MYLRLYGDDEKPPEYRLFMPVGESKKVKGKKLNKSKQHPGTPIESPERKDAKDDKDPKDVKDARDGACIAPCSLGNAMCWNKFENKWKK